MWPILLLSFNLIIADTLEDIDAGEPGTRRAHIVDQINHQKRKTRDRQQEEARDCEQKESLEDKPRNECSSGQKQSAEEQ